MRTIYISYREEDSGTETDALFDHLKSVYGVTNVHRTTHNREINIPDVRHLVGRHDVLLVVIGRYWAHLVNERGIPLFLQRDDPVRVEVATAIHLYMPILPILVDKAEMPEKDSLPPRLHALFTFEPFQVASITDNSIETLHQRIDHAILNRPRPAQRTPAQRLRRRIIPAAIVILLVVMGLFFFLNDDPAPSGQRPTAFIQPTTINVTVAGNNDALAVLATQQRLRVTPTAATPLKPSDVVLSGVGDVDEGGAIFRRAFPQIGYACADCHTVDSSAAWPGPSLLGLGERVVFNATYEDAVIYLYTSIVAPNNDFGDDYPTSMPTTYGLFLSDQQIRHLIVYLLSL